jgi:CheY-like chemotaxis protein
VSLRILFADDSMTAQNMGKKILTDAGYDVVAVSNGAAAVKKIAEQKPDIIILDVYMPGYSGLEVCEKVRASIDTVKTPVLLTVGKMEPYKAEDANRVKADGVIIKPFEATDLLAIVKKLEERITPSVIPPLSEQTMLLEPQTIRLEHPPEFAVHPADNLRHSSVATAAAETQADEGENTVHPSVDVPDHMATVSAFSELLGTEVVSPEPFAVHEQPVFSPSVETAPATFSLDPSSTFTAIPEIETASSFSSMPEAAPPMQAWESAAELRSEFAVASTPVAEPETTSEPDSSMGSGSLEVSEIMTPGASEPALAEPSSVEYADTQPIPVYEEPEAPTDTDAYKLEPTAVSLTEEVTVQRDPAFEPTMAEPVVEASSVIEPGLEPTIREQADVSPVADPNLISERAALESFPTRFGVENPEEVPVGIASELTSFASDTTEDQLASVNEDAEVSSEPVAPWAVSDRVAATMNVYGGPTEVAEEPVQESSVAQESVTPAVSEDDFEARVAAAMAAYEESQPTAAFASEMEPTHAEAERSVPFDYAPSAAVPAAQSEPEAAAFAAPELASPEFDVPVFTSEAAHVPVEAEPASFEYSPPATEPIVQSEPEATVEPQIVEPRIESAPVLDAEPVADEVQYQPEAIVESIHDQPPSPVQTLSVESLPVETLPHEPVPITGYAQISEVPQPSMEQIAASIETETPVVAVAAASMGADRDVIADVVHRVMERLKPELIAEIVRELNSKK